MGRLRIFKSMQPGSRYENLATTKISKYKFDDQRWSVKAGIHGMSQSTGIEDLPFKSSA